MRVRSEADAKRQLRDLGDDRDKAKDQDAPKVDVPPPTGAGAAGVVADGTDGVAIDYADFDQAERTLIEQYARIEHCLQRAGELDTPLPDGKGPVRKAMNKAFLERGGATPGGVQDALAAYLGELSALLRGLREVRTAHQRQDQHAADTFQAR